MTAGTPPAGYVPYPDPPALDVDFYKVGHIHQYPQGTQVVYSNLTPRSLTHAERKLNAHVYDNTVVVFGLQMVVREYLIRKWDEGFFNRPWEHVEYEYRESVDTGLNTVMDLSHLQALHALGYLPVEIRALPEGTLVLPKTPVFTIHNTLPEFYWLTNYLETVLSAETWKAMTAATIARNFRQTIEFWASVTGSPKAMIQWQCHDFSFRGLSGRADARTVGLAHLTSFSGTDTVSAIHAARHIYGADPRRHFVGGSVPATEHSVMCIDGPDNELQTYERILDLYPTGIVSIVSDSYDLWQVLTTFTKKLHDKIMARPGRVVFRPDSGKPADIICGTADSVESLAYPDLIHLHANDWGQELLVLNRQDMQFYKVTGKTHEGPEGELLKSYTWEPVALDDVSPQEKGAYYLLYEEFGGALNAKGYIDLDTHVGLIYGDSITPTLYNEILGRLAQKGFSPSNLVVGVGSYTYQFNTRDTFGFAVKATYGGVNGVGRTILKDPKTGDGTKKSATGLLRVGLDLVNNKVETLLSDGAAPAPDKVLAGIFDSGDLLPVFRDGSWIVSSTETLSEIRDRLGWSDAFPT